MTDLQDDLTTRQQNAKLRPRCASPASPVRVYQCPDDEKSD